MPRIRNDKTPSLEDTHAKCHPRYVCCLINDVHIQGTFIHSLHTGLQASHEIPLVRLHVLRGFLLSSMQTRNAAVSHKAYTHTVSRM